MRWFWIDRFTEFVRGEKATAVKNVSLAEEYLHDHFPGVAIMPTTLIIEGMAQTGGILVADAIAYKKQVVLAKVSSAAFDFDVIPGDRIEYRAIIHQSMAGGTLVKITTHVGDRDHGKAELFFAHLETGKVAPKLFKADEMHSWMDNLQIYDVAINPDGTRIERGNDD